MELENQSAGADNANSDNAAPGDQAVQAQAPSLESLGELLNLSEPQDEPSDGSNGAGKTDEPGGSQKLEKFNDLAGTLDMELDDLYKLQITSAEDGEPVTVEQLKDMYAKQGEATLREIEFEERRTTEEAKILQAQNEVREILAGLPEQAVKPEILEKIRARHASQLKVERARTLEVIPDWKNEKRREADIAGMTKHLQSYGYAVNYLENVVDHRQIKYIRDNYLREQRIRKALEAVKAGKPNPTTRSKPAKKAPTKRALAGVKRGKARNKLEAVFSDLE
jgi:hypothetical protein